jgi:hypothetical protein
MVRSTGRTARPERVGPADETSLPKAAREETHLLNEDMSEKK